jgi:hypothetical protein
MTHKSKDYLFKKGEFTAVQKAGNKKMKELSVIRNKRRGIALRLELLDEVRAEFYNKSMDVLNKAYELAMEGNESIINTWINKTMPSPSDLVKIYQVTQNTQMGIEGRKLISDALLNNREMLQKLFTSSTNSVNKTDVSTSDKTDKK